MQVAKPIGFCRNSDAKNTAQKDKQLIKANSNLLTARLDGGI
jgi:hypothetical protein